MRFSAIERQAMYLKDSSMTSIQTAAASCIKNAWRQHRDIAFYKQSLQTASSNILTMQPKKALKDRVGFEYECHRKRVYEHFGFSAVKEQADNNFKADWYIYKNESLVAIEEDKGHYMDSCFLDRAILSFAKQINICKKNNKDCPFLILSSFTTYRLYQKKMRENFEVLNPDLVDTMKEKLLYSSICKSDRLRRSLWFSDSTDSNSLDPYCDHADTRLILNDILMIKSLHSD